MASMNPRMRKLLTMMNPHWILNLTHQVRIEVRDQGDITILMIPAWLLLLLSGDELWDRMG